MADEFMEVFRARCAKAEELEVLENPLGPNIPNEIFEPEQRRLRQELAILDRRLEALDRNVPTQQQERNYHQIEPVQWVGKKRAFGDTAIWLFENGMIRATTKEDAVKKLCKIFVDQNGEPIKPESVLQSLRNRREFEHKDSRLTFPEVTVVDH